MNKINGYTKEEAQTFVRFMQSGVEQGKKLSFLFADYARQSGRAKGSVRNYYYQLLRSTENEQVAELLEGSGLHAQPFTAFTEEETDKVLRDILQETAKGISVRRAVLNLSNGDDRLMLRYQNKYRNVLQKQPERLQRLMQEAGLPVADDLQRRLEKEIDDLYDRLANDLRSENRRLTDTVRHLTEENQFLRRHWQKSV